MTTTTAPQLTAKGERTRATIIAAAAALMFQDGIAGTTIETVCAAAGVGKSQIYHYFQDKADLVRAVIESQAESLVSAQDPHLADIHGWESWDDWRDFLVETQRRGGCVGGCPLGSLAMELVDCDDLTRSVLVRSFQRWEAAFVSAIRQMKGLGLIRRDADDTVLASALLAAVQGGLLLSQTAKSVTPLQASLNGAIGSLRSFAV